MGVSLRRLTGKDLLGLDFETLCAEPQNAQAEVLTRGTVRPAGRWQSRAGCCHRTAPHGCLLRSVAALPQPAPGKALEEKPVSWAGARSLP